MCECKSAWRGGPFTEPCAKLFWDKLLQKTIQPELEEINSFYGYFSLQDKKCGGHASLIFSQDGKSGFSIELRFSKTVIDGEKRIILYTTQLENIDKPWKDLKAKITSSRKAIYETAIDIMLKFGRYDKAFRNCQDFVIAFCLAIGIQKPFFSVKQTAKFIGKIASTPLCAVAGVVFGAVTLVTAPISMPLLALKNDTDSPWWIPLTAPFWPAVLPIIIVNDVLTYDRDHQRSLAASKGLKVEDFDPKKIDKFKVQQK